jgi:formylmethanofuran dehydrogenase subunit E-like metal-binding protein
MKLNVDKEADALYLRIDDSPAKGSWWIHPTSRSRYGGADDTCGVGRTDPN